jgi:hypothetical protein
MTAVAGLGEVPSLGADTPVTLTAAGFSSAVGTTSFVLGGLAATLNSYSEGNGNALGSFDRTEITALGVAAILSKVPGGERYSETVGGMVEKALGIANQSKKDGCGE